MTERDKDFIGSIPEIYDTYLVPLSFEAYARDLADRIAALDPASVLQTAAGRGMGAGYSLLPELTSDSVPVFGSSI